MHYFRSVSAISSDVAASARVVHDAGVFRDGLGRDPAYPGRLGQIQTPKV